MSTMHAPAVASGRRPSALAWAARIVGIISIGLIAAMCLTRHENPFQLHGMDLLLFACFPSAVVAGLLIGWRWEFAGGALAMAGWIAFFGTSLVLFGTYPQDWWKEFLLTAVPAALFITSSTCRRRHIRHSDAAELAST